MVDRTPAQIGAGDDLRALSEAATPGPWRSAFPRVVSATGGEAHDLAFSVRPADAALIVWLRNHADAIANLIDAARTVCDGCLYVDSARLLSVPPRDVGNLEDALAALEVSDG